VSESERLCHGDGGPRVGCPPPEGVDVAYARTFRHGRRLLRCQLPVHTAWLGLGLLMRAGGAFFSHSPASGPILGQQLLIRASR
jgi:hypothetical protein